MDFEDNKLFIVEEVDSNDVPESELAEFQEIKPIVVRLPTEEENEDEPELIQKFVRGEGDFPEIYTKFEPEDDDDEDDEAEEWSSEMQHETHTDTDQEMADSSSMDEEPTTSALAKQANWKKSKPTKSKSRKVRRGDDGRPIGRYVRKCSVLSAALQGLMGEANLSYARGQIEMAEKLCLEIIRQNPMTPEPFLTLAEIYETRDPEKHLNFLTIAAHLNPHNRDLWLRVAEIHIAKGNFLNARIYYSKAIKVLSKDYDLRLRKALVFEKMNDIPNAMSTYLKMIHLLPPDKGQLCLETAKRVTAYYHKNGKLSVALEAMEAAYKLCAHLFSKADLNLFLDLLILNNQYEKIVNCLQERTNLRIEFGEDTKHKHNFYISIPDDFFPEFRSKLCISVVKLQWDHLIYNIIENVHEHIPTSQVNFYVDITEALIQEKKYAEAIELMRPITNCESIDSCPPVIWLHHAECLRNLNRHNEAIASYRYVIGLAPYCYEAKLALATVLKQQDRMDEAVKALEQAEDSERQPLHARLLYERFMLLKEMNDIDGYLEAGCDFLGRKSVKLRNREELQAFTMTSQIYNLDGLKTILQMRNMSHNQLAPDSFVFNIKNQTDISDISIDDEYQLFLELLRTGFAHKKFSFMERLCFSMATTKRFIDYHHELERIIILACYFNDDCFIAFAYLREMLAKDPSNNSLWNMISLFFQKGQDVRYYRYLRRSFIRNPHLKQIPLYLANYALNCSSYKLALKIYTQILKEDPVKSSLVALCIAVCFNQLSMQKRIIKSTAAVGQAIAFAEKYSALRRLECIGGNCTDLNAPIIVQKQDMVEQEICYNIGRIYHQAGIMHLAMEYYERALRVSHPIIEANEKYLGLKQETAYNLHLIYKASGNIKKARQLLYEYCVV